VKLALIGARRVRQGLGPFVARFLAEEGARVTAFLGTSADSVEAGGRELRQQAGIDAVGYTDLERMLAGEDLDALVILSPAETHGRYLRAALEAGLHVLCEKPLLFGGEHTADQVAELASAFRTRGLLLAENCQWPHVLPAFRALHGDPGPIQDFAMGLTPDSAGARMIADALPHPLSVAQALLPSTDARLEDLRFSNRDPQAQHLTIGARYATPDGGFRFEVQLIRGASLPREASLTINGRVARRRVRLEDYALFLVDGSREVGLNDPLRALLRQFLANLSATLAGAAPPDPFPITQRAAMLEHVLGEFQAPPQR
jgi:Oxidoreductase family, NAD-binding Rossmann fold